MCLAGYLWHKWDHRSCIHSTYIYLKLTCKIFFCLLISLIEVCCFKQVYWAVVEQETLQSLYELEIRSHLFFFVLTLQELEFRKVRCRVHIAKKVDQVVGLTLTLSIKKNFYIHKVVTLGSSYHSAAPFMVCPLSSDLTASSWQVAEVDLGRADWAGTTKWLLWTQETERCLCPFQGIRVSLPCFCIALLTHSGTWNTFITSHHFLMPRQGSRQWLNWVELIRLKISVSLVKIAKFRKHV